MPALRRHETRVVSRLSPSPYPSGSQSTSASTSTSQSGITTLHSQFQSTSSTTSEEIINADVWLRTHTLSNTHETSETQNISLEDKITAKLQSERSSAKKSWVWKHFNLVVQKITKEGPQGISTVLDMKYQCIVDLPRSTNKCNSLITPCGGTKSFIRHLNQSHNMVDPKITSADHSPTVDQASTLLAN